MQNPDSAKKPNNLQLEVHATIRMMRKDKAAGSDRMDTEMIRCL